ncbi:unnamed protein product [Parnassius mnemosyne]
MTSKTASDFKDEEWQNWLKVVSHYFETGQLCNIVSKSNDNRHYALVKILNKSFLGLLDSEATSSVISRGLSRKFMVLGFSIHEIPQLSISMADGTSYNIKSVIYLPILFMKRYKVVKFYIMDNLRHDLLFGMNFFDHFNLTIGYTEDIIKHENIQKLSNGELAIINISNSVKSRHELTEDQSKTLGLVVEDIKYSIGEGIGRTNLIEHLIDTGEHMPVTQRQYPFSPHIMQELEKEVDEMLAKDIIEPSFSSWRSPVLLVKKASGSNRLCLDSRQLNKTTKNDSYPLPRVTSILDSLKNAQYLSTLDLKSAFWQIPLETTSKEKTAFGLPGKGLFQFKVMPFGLKNASQTQQRLMDKLFPPEHEGKIFAYLDDIVVCSKTFEDHIKSLTLVKKQLLSAGLTVNFEKCQFARPSLKYLGYIVDKEGLRTDPEKVSAILNYPRPNTYTELKRFLGLASWYRRFVENFAIVAAPLHDLIKGLKKGQKIKWDAEAESAFIDLKTSLTSTPVLSCPDFNLEFIIQCDASNKGTGAVLFQTRDGIERPVAYSSRKFSERETKYSTSERELLSVIHAVEQFRPYIEGTHFKVITDHSALQWLYKNKDPHGRLARWAMRLQQFDFEVIYRKGKDNIVPDALSRAIPDKEINIIDIKPDDKDDWYNSIEKEITEGKGRDDWILNQGILWKYLRLKQFPDEKDSWKIAIPEKLRRQILIECHDSPTAGHLGIKKSINRTRQHYFWPSLIKDVKDYVRKCETCSKHKPSQLPPIGKMGKHKEVTEPFQIVSMDLMGPFPRSKTGNTMLLVVSCWFSKFVLLFPLRNGKTSTIVRIIEEQIFLIFGVPRTVICDNGKQFISSQFKELITNYNSKIWYTPYYHPQANPTERVNRVIGTAIASYIEDNHKDWDKFIPHIGHAIRTAIHEITGKTPSYLFFGRETSLQNKIDFGPDKDDYVNVNRNYFENNLRLREEIYKDVNKRLREAYEINSKNYNKRRRICNFNVGELVWKKTKPQSCANKNFMAKLSPKYEKAVISEKVSADVYILKSLRGKLLGTWHTSDLKRII